MMYDGRNLITYLMPYITKQCKKTRAKNIRNVTIKKHKIDHTRRAHTHKYEYSLCCGHI